MIHPHKTHTEREQVRTHTKYNIYSNPYASRAPYEASLCCNCDKETNVKGNCWEPFLCIECFKQAHYPNEGTKTVNAWYAEYSKQVKYYL